MCFRGRGQAVLKAVNARKSWRLLVMITRCLGVETGPQIRLRHDPDEEIGVVDHGKFLQGL